MSLTQHTLGLICMVLGGAIVGGFGLDLVGVPVRLWTLAPLVLLLIAFIGWNFWRQTRPPKPNLAVRQPPVAGQTYSLKGGWDWPEFLTFSAIILTVFVYLIWLGRPNFLPVGTTVDAVHQFGLADYINTTGRLPIHALDQRPNLQDGLEYPPAFVICAALLSQLLNQNVVFVLYPFAALCVALAVGLTFAIASFLLAAKSWRLPGAALAAGAALIPYGYIFESITDQNYFAQVLAQTLTLLGLFFLLQWQQHSNPENIFFLTLILLALLITYPTWAFILLATVIFVAISKIQIPRRLVTEQPKFKIQNRLSPNGGKSKILLQLVAILVSFGVVALLFLKDRLQTGLNTVANEGLVLLPDMARYSWPVVILATPGLMITLWRGDKAARVIALFSGLLFLAGLGFWLLKTVFDQGSFYSIYKLFYLGAFVLPLLALLALAQLVQFRKIGRQSALPQKILPGKIYLPGALAVFAVFLTVTWWQHPQPKRDYPVITAEGVQVISWVKTNLPVSEYTLAYDVPYGTPAYWLQVGFLKQPRGTHANNLLNDPPKTFPQWFYNPDSEQYFFTSDLGKINLDERLQILYQSGNSAVLTRTPAYKQENVSRPSLTVDYKLIFQPRKFKFEVQTNASEEPRKWLSIGLSIEASDGKAPPIFNESIHVEEGRARLQFLGLAVDIPELILREFYLNNWSPEARRGYLPMTPGRYSLYVNLLKDQTTVERRKLLDFEYKGADIIVASQPEVIVNGQFIFEGLPSATNTSPSQNQLLEINGEKFALQNYTLPNQVPPNQVAQLNLQWQLAQPTSRNYHLLIGVKDESGKVISESAVIPRNGLYPLWLWPFGKAVVVTQAVALPAKTGRYSLTLTLLDLASGQKSVTIPLDKIIEVR